MDDEFKLCWKNFQDNIASGFQNLYDRGDLVDVTLACDGKLLHAHKIVLAICSPYFQEIFITNPCKHPIIILKDVTFNIMCELLEFMYQGVVNVKHTELQSFMKIGQLLQIKGLATNTSSSTASTSSEKSSSQIQNAEEINNASAGGGGSGTGIGAESLTNSNAKNSSDADANNVENNSSSGKSSNIGGGVGVGIGGTSTAPISQQRSHSPASSPTPIGFVSPLTQQSFKSSTDSNTPTLHHPYHSTGAAAAAANMKRHSDISSDALSIYSRKQLRRSVPSVTDHSSEHNDSTDVGGMDQVNAEDFFLSAIPHISMVENRYDLNSVKRESAGDHHGPGGSTASLRNSFGPAAFSFDYNLYKNSSGGGSGGSGTGAGGAEFPNDLHMSSDYAKNFGNHMDIPQIAPGEHWFQGRLEFMLSQRGKPLLVHDGHTFGIQYVRKDKKYWQCNLSRKFNCKARVTTTDTGEIIVTNNEHCHTEIRQHLRKDYQRNKVVMNALINLSTSQFAENLRRHNAATVSTSNLSSFQSIIHNAGSGGGGTSSSLSSSLHAMTNDDNDHGGILDLGKSATREDVIGTSSRSLLQQQQDVHGGGEADDDDDDLPLDCGMRSNAAISTAISENILKNDNNRIHENNNIQQPRHSDSNWKCKKENLDS